ncbi:MAG: DUF6108 family protein [Prevotella sp.]|nr:DUF6108 family protein [Prevotella sp.]
MRIQRSLLLLTFLMTSLMSQAQTGLKVNELFLGHIIPQEQMIETRVRGKTLSKYQLTYYRSLRFTATEEEALRLRRLVDDDSRGQFASVYETRGSYTQKVQVSRQGDKNRFLCYQEQWKRKEDRRQVTVIYMEGTVTSLKQLEELLK